MANIINLYQFILIFASVVMNPVSALVSPGSKPQCNKLMTEGNKLGSL